MQINNLYKGQIVKNYKELCKILGEDAKKGGSVKYHLKEFERYFSFHKEGYKFIIDKIYKEPLPIQTNKNALMSKSGVYNKYTRLLILNMLSQNEAIKNNDNVILIGKNKMLYNLNMINENYRYGSYNREKMANYVGMDIKYIHEFYDTNTRKLRDSVEKTLDRLMNNERAIFWNNTKIVGMMNKEHREATDEEISFIVGCETEALKEMGVNDIVHIYIANRAKELYKKVNEKLLKKGILYAYNGYRIIFSDHIYDNNKQLEYKLEIQNEIKNKNELNDKVYLKLNQSAKNRHERTIKELNKFFGEPDPKWIDAQSDYKKLLMNNDFISNNKKLIDICIDDAYDDICEIVAEAWRESNGVDYVNIEHDLLDIFEN